MFSSVTGRKLMAKEVGPSYWKNNMTSTVQFDAALTACVQDQLEDFVVLEIGPHPALKGPAVETLQCQQSKPVNYFNSLFRNRNDLEALLENVGDMIASGIGIEERNINGKENAQGIHCTYEFPAVLKDLPPYQWDHSTPLWYEARSSRNQRFRRLPRHQFLGSRYLEDSPSNPSWRSLLNLDDVPWLAALKVS
jgi:acyl transferase domain-containing protein